MRIYLLNVLLITGIIALTFFNVLLNEYSPEVRRPETTHSTTISPGSSQNSNNRNENETQPKESPEWVQVERVIDGDTIEVVINGSREHVRFIGINSPEVAHGGEPAECFGIEAKKIAQTILNHQFIRLIQDSTQKDRDKYGRLLRYVILADETNVNHTMLEQGYAFEYTYRGKPYQHQVEFRQTQKKAKAEGKGLWNEKTCNGKR